MFDSGVGGLTVARAVMNQLPGEQILYIGDTANTPYGPRPIAEVRELALGIMDELVDSGVKMLVIACNTASAAVLHDARSRYTLGRGVPVVEVIHPAARAAARVTRNGRVGLIATQGTVDSRAYADALAAVPGVELLQVPCPRFVELAERGVTTGPEVMSTAEGYLAPIKRAGVDTLILGCTHYPLLAGPISYVMGEEVTLVTSSEETAKDVYRELARRELLRDEHAGPPEHEFRSTGDPHAFTILARRFLGPEVRRVTRTDAGAEVRTEPSAGGGPEPGAAGTTASPDPVGPVGGSRTSP
ncbi:MAG: glutamate racemase [Actinomyces sp.]|uniref:glutamate racemase n=1 Tax=Actinomyces sp. TaxID=29317 RepID=UPI0026DB0252|nr:glutamate racemase [Actinomyces sp.]MDO4243383.1 glutamate racemase [Actinomyces sp.]